MIPRYRAWDKIHKTMYEVDDIMSIDFGKSEIDRIILKYRTKGKVGRQKITVKKALYKAYALGV